MKKKLNWSTASAWDQYAYGADQGNWNLCRAVCNCAGCGLGVPEDQLPGYTPAESKIWWEMFRVADFTHSRGGARGGEEFKGGAFVLVSVEQG